MPVTFKERRWRVSKRADARIYRADIPKTMAGQAVSAGYSTLRCAQMVSKPPARMQGRIDGRERGRAYSQRTEKNSKGFQQCR